MQRYAHIFWIPLFPIGKVFATQCQHCRHVLEENEIREAYRMPYQEMKQQLTIPIWTFTGLGIITVLIFFGIFNSMVAEQKNQALIEYPLEGDIYEYKTDDGQYTLMKVAGIRSDTVFVYPNNYAATKLGGLRKLKEQADTTYSEFTISFLKSDLRDLLEKNQIMNIIRESDR